MGRLPLAGAYAACLTGCVACGAQTTTPGAFEEDKATQGAREQLGKVQAELAAVRPQARKAHLEYLMPHDAPGRDVSALKAEADRLQARINALQEEQAPLQQQLASSASIPKQACPLLVLCLCQVMCCPQRGSEGSTASSLNARAALATVCTKQLYEPWQSCIDYWLQNRSGCCCFSLCMRSHTVFVQSLSSAP